MLSVNEDRHDQFRRNGIEISDGAIRWHVGFRHTPSIIPIGSVDAEVKPVRTQNGVRVIRRLLLQPKLRKNRILEIQAEVYDLHKFKEILKAESERIGYLEDNIDAIQQSRKEVMACNNSLNRIRWLLDDEGLNCHEIIELIEHCKNYLMLLMNSLEEVEVSHG